MLCDYHVHSLCSFDGESGMTEIALAAAKAGLDEICFTDHADLDDEDGKFNPLAWRGEEYFSAFEEARRAAGGKISLRLGLELGEGNHYPEKAREIAATVPDFIIGSVHNLRGTADFWRGRAGGEDKEMFKTRERCESLLECYVSELEETERLGEFDVIGHIGYPLRYMRAFYPDITLEGQTERLAELFRRLIRAGKGIEVNTSGLRGELGETMPAPWLIRLYRDLGGEIITIGSDAHSAKDTGKGIKDAKNLIRGIGFTRFCVYNRRKENFVNLD